MKIKNIAIVFLIGCIFTVSYGSDNNEIKNKINELIKEVKKAPPSERYKKMNKLKLFVKKLRIEERIKIMKKLHKQLHGNTIMKRPEHIKIRDLHKHMKKEYTEIRNMKESCKSDMKKIENEGYMSHMQDKKEKHKRKWRHQK